MDLYNEIENKSVEILNIISDQKDDATTIQSFIDLVEAIMIDHPLFTINYNIGRYPKIESVLETAKQYLLEVQ